MRSFILFLALSFSLSACSGGGTSRMEARAMKNPIEPTSKSIESGKIVYDRYCAKCHGVAGKGDGEEAAKLVQSGHPKPSDLTDNKWDHGSTEGEIFVNVRDGVGATGIMKGLNGQPGASATDMWNIVNYLRSLGKAGS